MASITNPPGFHLVYEETVTSLSSAFFPEQPIMTLASDQDHIGYQLLRDTILPVAEDNEIVFRLEKVIEKTLTSMERRPFLRRNFQMAIFVKTGVIL